jgi:hypothetical protein
LIIQRRAYELENQFKDDENVKRALEGGMQVSGVSGSKRILALGVCDTALYDLKAKWRGRNIQGKAVSLVGGRESGVWAKKATKSLKNFRVKARRGEGSVCVTDR